MEISVVHFSYRGNTKIELDRKVVIFSSTITNPIELTNDWSFVWVLRRAYPNKKWNSHAPEEYRKNYEIDNIKQLKQIGYALER